MSILEDQSKPAPEMIAESLRAHARGTFHQMKVAFESGARAFWQNPQASPAEIAAALGTDAKEIFELHGKLGAMLASVKPESVAATSAIVGRFTYNANGSVTVQS